VDNKESCRLWKRTLKKLVLSWYGGRCVCCGIAILDFLTLDHIFDDGGREELSTSRTITQSGRPLPRRICAGNIFYSKIKKLGYEKRPKDLQILCWNCQWGKRLNNGFCPHHNDVDLRRS
jgi:hypothetical protein